MKNYTVEIAGTKLTARSDEYGTRVGEHDEPLRLFETSRLRGFLAELESGEQVPVYVEEGEGDHEYTVYIRGEAISAHVVTPRDERLIALGKNTAAGHSTSQMVVAPMPGMLKQMLVAEGDVVRKGDALCILEAMKMENEIKASARLVVRRVIAQAGSAVEKGAPLLELQPETHPVSE